MHIITTCTFLLFSAVVLMKNKDIEKLADNSFSHKPPSQLSQMTLLYSVIILLRKFALKWKSLHTVNAKTHQKGRGIRNNFLLYYGMSIFNLQLAYSTSYPNNGCRQYLNALKPRTTHYMGDINSNEQGREEYYVSNLIQAYATG